MVGYIWGVDFKSTGYFIYTPAIGDGVLWATPCKRAEAEAQLGDSETESKEPQRVGRGKNP